MTLAQIQASLADVTLQPGWSVFAWQHDHEGVWVTIRARVEDAYRPGEGERIDLGINSPLPPIPDVAYLDAWLEWRLGIIARHESREWFRRGGRPVFDPHADGVNDPPEDAA
jgi:hypothetical protein